MDHGENYMTVVDEDGNEELFKILFTFESEEFDKSYVVYCPAGADEGDDEEIEVFAAAFSPDEESDEGKLMPIETDEEWELIDEMLNTFSAGAEDKFSK